MTDPKLVEALADLLRTAGDETLWWPEHVARKFVTRHRLVQRRKEPDGWVSPENAALIAENERLRNVLGIADAALLRGISACANLCGDDTPAPVRKLAADAVLVMRDAREALEATDD